MVADDDMMIMIYIYIYMKKYKYKYQYYTKHENASVHSNIFF